MAHIDDEQRKLAGIRPMRASLEEARQEALDENLEEEDTSIAAQLAKKLKKKYRTVRYDANKQEGHAKLGNIQLTFREHGSDDAVWLEIGHGDVKAGSVDSAMSFIDHLQKAFRAL